MDRVFGAGDEGVCCGRNGRGLCLVDSCGDAEFEMQVDCGVGPDADRDGVVAAMVPVTTTIRAAELAMRLGLEGTCC